MVRLLSSDRPPDTMEAPMPDQPHDQESRPETTHRSSGSRTAARGEPEGWKGLEPAPEPIGDPLTRFIEILPVTAVLPARVSRLAVAAMAQPAAVALLFAHRQH